MSSAIIHVAIAILYRQGRFLLQLRDDIPGIRYPGHWALFGGHLEPDENPDMALIRELQEEINYTPVQFAKVGCYSEPGLVRHVYHGPLTVDIQDLSLHEGWDMALLTAEEIQRGDRYSDQARQVKPLGQPHQKILLDFIRADHNIQKWTR